MERGYTVAECGWQWGLTGEPGQMTADIPEELGAEGHLTGKTMLEWQADESRTHLFFSEGLRVARSYPTIDVDDLEAVLYVREHLAGPRQP